MKSGKPRMPDDVYRRIHLDAIDACTRVVLPPREHYVETSLNPVLKELIVPEIY